MKTCVFNNHPTAIRRANAAAILSTLILELIETTRTLLKERLSQSLPHSLSVSGFNLKLSVRQASQILRISE